MEEELWDSNGLLKKIDGSSIHKICSGQVVLDLVAAVKELIENSIDANADNIKIYLEQGGFGCIQVIDNGCGIKMEDYESIALKHYTSKIRDFTDLQNGVSSLGFRGEALSSLCSLSQRIVITTRTEKDENGVRIQYDKSGKVSDITPKAHSVRYNSLKNNTILY